MATRARHFEAALAGFRDNSGNSLNGGKLQFYIPGTSSTKNAYTDRDKTEPVTEVTLDANGRAEVYGDGWYDIKLLDSEDVVLATFEYVYLQRTSYTTETKTADFTATTDVDSYLVDTTSGNVTVTMPAASDMTYPITVAKKTDDTNTVTIAPAGAETIDGGPSYTMSVQSESVSVASDGANLYALGKLANSAITISTPATTSTEGKTRYATSAETKRCSEASAAVTPSGLASTLGVLGSSHYGLLLSNNSSDPSHDIDISVGACLDSTNAAFLVLSTGLTKQIDAAWAQGTDAGGFPSGLTLETSVADRANSTAYSLGDLIKVTSSPWWWECTTAGTSGSSQPSGYATSNSTVSDGTAVFTRTEPEWYRVFLIASSDLSLIDAGFDSDASATNLLSDASSYSLYRQIGWVLNDGAGNIVPFFSDSDGRIVWDTPKKERTRTALPTNAETMRLTAPPGSRARVSLPLDCSAGSGDLFGLVTETRQTDTAPTSETYNLRMTRDAAASQRSQMEIEILCDASSEIRLRASSTDLRAGLICVGYKYLWD